MPRKTNTIKGILNKNSVCIIYFHKSTVLQIFLQRNTFEMDSKNKSQIFHALDYAVRVEVILRSSKSCAAGHKQRIHLKIKFGLTQNLALHYFWLFWQKHDSHRLFINFDVEILKKRSSFFVILNQKCKSTQEG